MSPSPKSDRWRWPEILAIKTAMRISVELIPRGELELLADAATVRSAMPAANTFNIPDLMRFPLRSWDACALVRSVLPTAIPHIRAIEIAPGDELAFGDAVVAAGLTEILVIKGDPPSDVSRRTYPNSSEAVIRRFKRHHPKLQVYAAFDPYRHGFRDELAGVERKLEAGADGFFTQPFFDLRLLAICADMLQGAEVFWGIAPVLGARSKAYWETTNRVVFPSDFSATLEWNRAFARAAVALIKSLKANVYFMPIGVNLTRYLGGLLESSSI